MMDLEALRKHANNMANSLGITLYIRDGAIHQHGPGERIDPPKSAQVVNEIGRFEGLRVTESRDVA